ncbi:SGNH/GDSL hydrolase family protein [Streptomyces sp. NPDC092296]|uniref:SGNH/GDSL hydrolase family protein n=1 Tax=Streptomyces sp. NPDC092296 TaxID=3366012 RepID=UPI0037F6B93A
MKQTDVRPSVRRRTALGAALLGGALSLTTGLGAVQAEARPAHHGATGYVALGDSYASAPAVPQQTDADCQRSSGNYPSLLAAAKHARLTDVSCAGATTAQLTAAQGTAPAQLDALTRGTRLVTLTIGGNDIGFSSDIATCAGLTAGDPAGSPCRTHFTTGGTDQLAQRIAQTGPKIAQALRGIRQRAPHARIAVVGYPDLFPEDGVGCTSAAVPFAAGDFAYLRDTEKKLNAMLRTEARRHGAVYVDTYAPSIGHDMCQPSGRRWIETLAPETPAAPAHPNAAGEQAMARAVGRALDRCGARRRRAGHCAYSAPHPARTAPAKPPAIRHLLDR